VRNAHPAIAMYPVSAKCAEAGQRTAARTGTAVMARNVIVFTIVNQNPYEVTGRYRSRQQSRISVAASTGSTAGNDGIASPGTW
jgi:hypothetical protein